MQYPINRATMTVKEAAAYMGISITPMYAITERADFDALIRVGKKKLILRARLDAWLDRQAVGDVNVAR